MKRTNKKGFTLVELVIVIAIIAILAAVLIPTFAGVIRKANESAALQRARNAYTECMTATDASIEKIGATAIIATSTKVEEEVDHNDKLTENQYKAIQEAIKDTGVESVSYDTAFTVKVNNDYTFTYTTANGWQKVNN